MKASLVLVAISACLAPTAAAVPHRASAPSLVKRSTLVAAKDGAGVVAPRRSANPGALAATVGIGLAVRALPAPAGTAPGAMSLLAIFIATIAGLVLEPLPTGGVCFLALTTAVITKTLSFKEAFGAFTNEVIWLIVLAVFFSRGFVSSGLGNRVATFFVSKFGGSSLGLGYGLAISEALIAPAMPSTTARASIYVPLVNALAAQADSYPLDKDPTGVSAGRLGGFLSQCHLQTSVHSSAATMTSAAQNLLGMKIAAEMGYPVPGAFGTWLLAACVPAVAGMIVMPALVHYLHPPSVKATPGACEDALDRLTALGPLSRDERLVVGTMLGTVLLWVFGEQVGVAPAAAAMIGLSAQIALGVTTWPECAKMSGAWDTLFFFGSLVGMAGALSSRGLIGALSDFAKAQLDTAQLPWPAAFGLLHCVYMAVHYLFASQTAHVAALSAAFLGMMVAAGVPPVLAVLTLTFNSNLQGALTNYASAQSALYYAAGFNDMATTMRLGAICGGASFLIWAVVGGVWWNVIGLTSVAA